jgi:tetratricopeptide (TPR) repeat protein
MEAVKDPARHIRWRFGPISSKEPPPIVLDKLPVCGNCHSFSADGKTFAMEVDAGNDKGSYTVGRVEKEIVLDSSRIITWADYKREDGDPTFGMLCQVSPEGRYVVGTVKDRSLAVERPDLAFSQLFFPVKGILAIYDRERKAFSALPGADDPRFVQTNGTWSPDGKSIVFARSCDEAYDPPELRDIDTVFVPPEAAEEFVSGGREFCYDLYRVPFNQGKGGKAEPIKGASNNGLSNYFAKFSPDGKWIVFCRAKSFMLLQPDSELYIIPADGGEARRLECNTRRMNSWHSWSPNGRWLVFSSKANSPYTQLFLTHIDEQGCSSPPVVLARFTEEKRAANIPEFVNADPQAIGKIRERFVDDLSFCRAALPYLLNNDREGAVREFSKALQVNPRNLQALFEVGTYLLDEGQLDAARPFLTRAVVDPDTSNVKPGMLNVALAKAETNLGILEARAGQYEEAVAHARKAVQLLPDYAVAHRTLGAALLELGRQEEGKEHLGESLRLDPEDTMTNCRYADVLVAEGLPDQAVGCYEKALKQDSHFLPALLGLTMIRAASRLPALRDGGKALELATMACELTRYEDASALDGLAAAHAERGQFSEAVRVAQDAERVARASGEDALLSVIQQRLELYRQSKPLRLPHAD